MVDDVLDHHPVLVAGLDEFEERVSNYLVEVVGGHDALVFVHQPVHDLVDDLGVVVATLSFSL